MRLEQIRQIERDLEDNAVYRLVGTTGMTLLAMLVSAIPGVGGPSSIVLEEVKKRVFEPDYAEHVKALAQAFLEMAPVIEKTARIDERVSLIEELLKSSKNLQSQMETAAQKIGGDGLFRWNATNLGGVQTVEDLVLRNSKVVVTTSEGGVTDVSNMEHVGGSASFTVGPGSRQRIRASRFEGGDDESHSSVHFNGAASIGSDTEVEINAPPRDGRRVGLRITKTTL